MAVAENLLRRWPRLLRLMTIRLLVLGRIERLFGWCLALRIFHRPTSTYIPRQRCILAMHVQRRFLLSRRKGAYGTAAWVGLGVFLFTYCGLYFTCIIDRHHNGPGCLGASHDDVWILLSKTEVQVWQGRTGTGGRWPGQAGDSATPCCGVVWFWFWFCLNTDCLCISGQT